MLLESLFIALPESVLIDHEWQQANGDSLRETQRDADILWAGCFSSVRKKLLCCLLQNAGLRYNAATVTCQCCTKSRINTFCCHLLVTKVPLFQFWEPGGWRSMCKCESRSEWGWPCDCCLHGHGVILNKVPVPSCACSWAQRLLTSKTGQIPSVLHYSE